MADADMSHPYYEWHELKPIYYQGREGDEHTTWSVRGNGTGTADNPHTLSLSVVSGPCVLEFVEVTAEDLRRLGEFLVAQSKRRAP